MTQLGKITAEALNEWREAERDRRGRAPRSARG